MKKRTGIIGVLIAIIALGIGYAAITAIPLKVTGTGTIIPDQDNFKVIFIDSTDSGDGTRTVSIDPADETKATISVSDLNYTNETATFTFEVQNISDENLIADLQTPTIEYTNQEYFLVTAELGAETSLAVDDIATLTVTVKVIKAPINDTTSDITVTLNANPREGA